MTEPTVGRMRGRLRTARHSALLLDLPWVVASVAVVVAAMAVSVHPTDRADVPALQLSLSTVRGTTAQVIISAGRPAGQLALSTLAPDGTTLSYPLFTVTPGHPATLDVVLPDRGRFVIDLDTPNQTRPLRSLIVDR